VGERTLSLREELNALPIVDAHEHLRGHVDCQPRRDVTGFLTASYLGSLLPYADPTAAARIADESRPDSERWQNLVSIWRLVGCTGYGHLVSRMLRCWGLTDQLEEASHQRIQEQLSSRSRETSLAAYRQAHITKTITHYLAHPSCGGLENVTSWLAGDLTFDVDFYPLLGTLPLHEFLSRDDVERLGQVCNVAIASLENLVEAIEVLIGKAVQHGVVGLKDHAAYTRGLAFGPPDRAAAVAEMHRLLGGERFEQGARHLSDYLFHRIVQLAIDLDVPIAIHTGYLVGMAHPKANLQHLAPILEAYPRARFDLYHLNYPWLEELFAAMKRFPNTWANCCWTHIIDPVATVRFLQRALTTIPANHIIGFGGDFTNIPEPVLAHREIALDNISAALEDAVAGGWCSRSTALDIASLWLCSNAENLYGI
jgi:predicted TIM-barrel fold metal-dependent hydrolase